MSNTGVIANEAANRYTSALLDLAKDAKALKNVAKDISTLKGLFAKSADLRDLVASPVIADDAKLAGLLALAKKAKLGKLTTQFIGICVQNQRAADLPDMIAVFEEKLAKERGTGLAHVYSATKLSAANLSAIKTQLKKSKSLNPSGRGVTLETHIDPDLLGGFAVQVGSRYYDNTLKTKLEGLKLAMKEV